MTSPSPKKPLQVKLDMYLAPPSEPGFRAMTDCLCHDLGACARLAPDRDPAELAQNGQLILGHICAITFARAKTGLYHYLGALSPRAPETPQGHYRSVIVAHKDSTIQSMSDIDPTRHQIAVNEIGSFSGQIILSHMLLGHGALAFPHQTLTGGHALSAKAVAEERADLTALDEISYALIKRNDPKTAKNLRIIGHSASHPGLAFVTSGQTDAATLALLRARLLQFFETPSGQALAEVLDLRGATYIDPAAYKPLCDL